MHHSGLLILLSGFIVIALVSRRLERVWLTVPILATAFGILLGPDFLDTAAAQLETGLIHHVAEITLMIVLFTDASRIRLKELQQQHDLPVRLLTVAMPLSIGLGTVVGKWLLPHWSWAETALLAAVLVPTDAALGQTVVSSPSLPGRIRQTLNVESGLNDGIALPAVILFLCAVGAQLETHPTSWGGFFAAQILGGLAIGAGFGLLAGWILQQAHRQRSIAVDYQRPLGLLLAVSSYYLAESLGGNGFVSCFTAGLLVGNVAHEVCESLHEFGEAEGVLLSTFTFLLFGAVIFPSVLADIEPRHFLYVFASLTLVRMLPVALSLIDKKLMASTLLFLGWFGPRGLASMVFGLFVVERLEHAEHELLTIVSLTVLSSIVLHGISSVPGTRWYARRSQILREQASEMKSVRAFRSRFRG